MLENLIAGWDGEETVIRFDRPAGTWMFICVHSTVLGPAGGGTRMATYPAGCAQPGSGTRRIA